MRWPRRLGGDNARHGTNPILRRGASSHYSSPEDGLLSNTVIVEGPRKLVIFDAQFFLLYAGEAADYADSLGKPVERIVLSHVHLDHWAGLGIVAKMFPGAPICAPAGVADYLRTRGQSILDARRSAFGNRIPPRPTIPTHVLPGAAERIDGVRFEWLRFVDAESAVQLVAILPEQRTLLAFDLAFTPADHVFTVTSHFDNWIEILSGLKARTSFDTIVSGHGAATDRAALDATIAYLRHGKQAHAQSASAAEYADRMKVLFSDRRHPNWIELSSELLYGVVDAYAADPVTKVDA
jgi:glyoxylase-like metal-dependent hydrolase (beta-lactamase superfamily II)